MCAATLDVTKAWEMQKLEHDRILNCCAISPCGKYAVAGAQDEKLLRWDLETGQKEILEGHESWVQTVCFHPDKKHLISADLHGAIRAWDYTAEKPTPLWTVESAHDPWVVATAVTQDGQKWITAGTDGRVRFWNVADGKEAGELKGHETEVYSLAVHPDGKHLVSGDLFGKIIVWNLETGENVRTIDASVLHTREEDFLADVGGVRSLAFNADGSILAAGGMTDIKGNTFCPGTPAILIINFADGALKQTLRQKAKSDGYIKGLCFLPDGTIAGHGENLNAKTSMEFWNIDKPEPIHSIPRDSAYGLSLHPDGIRLALASFAPNGRQGNGRSDERGEYVSHNGSLVVFSLQEKPAETKA